MIQLRTLIETLLDELLYFSTIKKHEITSSSAALEEIELSIPLAIHNLGASCMSVEFWEEMTDVVVQEVSRVISIEKFIPMIGSRIRNQVKIELTKFGSQITKVPVDEKVVLWDLSQRLLVLFLGALKKARLGTKLGDSRVNDEFDVLTQELYLRLSPRLYEIRSEKKKGRIMVVTEPEQLELLPPRSTGNLKVRLRF